MRETSEYQEILDRLDALRDAFKAGNGQKPFDPSANVLSLVAAAMQRQDDLRAADNKRSDDIRVIKEGCGREISELREKLRDAESKRIDAVNLAESRRLDARLSQQETAV